MKTATCPWEERLRKALANGAPAQGLLDHARQCPVCGDVLAVSTWMLEFRELTLDSLRAHRPLPSALELWERSTARRIDLATAQKALKPIAVFRKIAWCVLAVGSAALLLLEWEQLKNLLASLPVLGQLPSFLKKSAESGGGSLAQAVAVAGLGLAVLVFLVLLTGIQGGDKRAKYPLPGK